MKEGESVQQHVKVMTEVFETLSVIGDPITEEDRVVHLLASLPEAYDMIVTALESSSNVPIMETVIERLLHEERKMKEREGDSGDSGKVFAAYRAKRVFNPLVPKLFGRARKNLIFYRGIEHYRFIFFTRCWLGKHHSNHIHSNLSYPFV